MKWSRLSIGQQIGLIALVMAAYLTGVIAVNASIVLKQNRNAWIRESEAIHREYAAVAAHELDTVSSAAMAMANAPLLLPTDAAGSDTSAAVLTLLTQMCPAVDAAMVTENSAEARSEEAMGFSGLRLREDNTYAVVFSTRCGVRTLRLRLDINAAALSDRLPETDGVRAMVLDADNHIAACTDKRQIGYIFTPTDELIYTDSDGFRYAQHETELGSSGYTLVTLTSGIDEMGTRVNRILPLNLAAMMLALLLTAGGFYFLRASVSKPIEDMSDILSIMVKRPEAHISMRLRGNKEMAELSASFNRMMAENEQLNADLVDTTAKLYQAELIRRKTDMAMLVTQINPHFLYNTLEVIKGMAYKVGNRQIADMIRALGFIFRYSLKAPEMVTLAREAEMLRNYLMIQKTRFGDRFEVEYDLPEELMAQDMPKMILQPLCENAITHGLEMLESGGRLAVSARLSYGVLTLTVEDNGLGMDEETLLAIRSKLNAVSDVTSLYELGTDGLGLVNVHGRIRMRYGEKYGLSIISEKDRGTRVEVKLPGRRPEDYV